MRNRKDAGERPGINVQWKVFNQRIREDCNATATDRGYSDERLENIARKVFG
jgi:hypothetical protein